MCLCVCVCVCVSTLAPVFGLISAPLSNIIFTSRLEELAEQCNGVLPLSSLYKEKQSMLVILLCCIVCEACASV